MVCESVDDSIAPKMNTELPQRLPNLAALNLIDCSMYPDDESFAEAM